MASRMEETLAAPQVSVLIVSRNNAGALRRCLAALEASAERDKMEILVVDAGSRDECTAIDSEFPGIVMLRLPRNFGLAKSLNIGMRTAKGEFFFFLDATVEVRPETVSLLAARLTAAPEAQAVCPLLVTPEGEPAGQFYKLPPPNEIGAAARTLGWRPAGLPDLSAESVPVEFPSLAALMVRSFFLRGLRYFDQRYGQHWVDAEVCFQIRRVSRKILLAPGIRAVLHPREDSGDSRVLLAADWASGAAVFAGKHYGFAAGLKVRVGSAWHALISALKLRDAGYHFSRLAALLGGQKIDGTQRDA